MRPDARDRQSGVALLAALLVTALLTVVVMQFTLRTQVEYRRTARWVSAKRAELLADSGTILAAQILRFDWFSDREAEPAVDHLAEPWSGTFGPVEDGAGGTITVRIDDESGLYDLNRLRSPSLDERTRAERVFDAAGIDRSLVGPLVDWLDADSDRFPYPEGAEIEYYRALVPPYAPRNGALRTFAELALVRGIQPVDLVRLRRLATVTADAMKKINVNTAPAEVLRAVVPGLSDEIALSRFLERRGAGPIESQAQVNEIEGLDRVRFGNLAAVRSDLFRVRSTGEVDGVLSSVEAVLRRDDGLIQLVYWARRRGPNVPPAEPSVSGSLDDFSVFAHGRGLGGT